MLEIGIALMFIGLSGVATKVILENLDDDEPIEIPGQFKRLGGVSGAGMDSADKDAYIKHLREEVARLSAGTNYSPTPPWAFTGLTGDGSDAQGDANARTLVRPSITSPSPASITPQNHLPSPPPSPLASPPPSPLASPIPSPEPVPDYILSFPPVDLPFDAPSNRQKCLDLILRSFTKAEVLEEVWGLTKKDKTGRPESKYFRCSQLFDQIKADAENQIKLAAYKEIEFMENL
jgi:hypothetical protein